MTHSIFSSSRISRWFVLACFLVLVFAARAQGVTAGSVDLAGTAGFSNLIGVDNNRHPSFGGSAAYNISPGLAVGGEFNDLPLGSVTSSGITASESLKLFGVFVRLAPSKPSRIVPYLTVGAGGAHLNAVAGAQGISVSGSQNGEYFGAGAGASFYIGSRWGVRPEFRYERQQFASTTIGDALVPAFGQNNYRATVSLFYQWGGKHSRSN